MKIEATLNIGTDEAKIKTQIPEKVILKNSLHTRNEYATKILFDNSLPFYFKGPILDIISQTIDEETSKLRQLSLSKARDTLTDSNIDQYATFLGSLYETIDPQYAQPITIPESYRLGRVYHDVMHSEALGEVLQLEQRFNEAYATLICERDLTLTDLEQHHQDAMRSALDDSLADGRINALAQHQLHEKQIFDATWASKLSHLGDEQRRRFWTRIQALHDRYCKDEETVGLKDDADDVYGAASDVPRKSLDSTWDPIDYMRERVESVRQSAANEAPRLEESFTISLGGQLKSVHNIRLLTADVADFCASRVDDVLLDPYRVSTAMTLYSGTLSALLLLVDPRQLGAYGGSQVLQRKFQDACEQRPDFHFPSLSAQLEAIRTETCGAVLALESASTRLEPGDLYVTRHGNLSRVHCVLHLVASDDIVGPKADLTSRHRVIDGIKQAMRVCFRHSVTTISVPLLLSYDMTDLMTAQWCLRRAELVFKCVKAFVIELCNLYGGEPSRTVQFIVPNAIPDQIFAQLNALVPTIFRQTNPKTF